MRLSPRRSSATASTDISLMTTSSTASIGRANVAGLARQIRPEQALHDKTERENGQVEAGQGGPKLREPRAVQHSRFKVPTPNQGPAHLQSLTAASQPATVRRVPHLLQRVPSHGREYSALG